MGSFSTASLRSVAPLTLCFSLVGVIACAGAQSPTGQSQNGALPAQSATCQANASRAAELWTEAEAAELKQAFIKASPLFNEETFQRLSASIERVQESFERAHNAACKDTDAEAPSGDPKRAQKIQLCLGDELFAQRAFIHSMKRPKLTQIRSMDMDLLLLEAGPSLCENPARYSEFDEAPSDAEARRLRELLAELDLDAVSATNPPSAKQLEALETAQKHESVGIQLASLNEAGWIQLSQDNLQAAADLAARARELAQKHSLPLAEARSSLLLARALISSDQHLDQAESLLIHAIRLRSEALGSAHLMALVSNLELAMLQMKLGKPNESIDLLERALNEQIKARGEGHLLSALLYQQLGQALASAGQSDTAIYPFEQALKIYQQLLGAGHPQLIESLNQLGLTHYHVGNNAQSAKLQARAVELGERLFGKRHPSLWPSYHYLGSALMNLSENEAAARALSEAYTIAKDALGEENQQTLIILSDLSITYSEQKQFAKAIELQTRILEVRRRTLGERHVDTGASLALLGILHKDLGDYPTAYSYLEKSLAVLRALNMHGSPIEVATRNHIRAVCEAGHQPACALED